MDVMDILRLMLIGLQILSVCFTIIVVVRTSKVSIPKLLSALIDWYKDAMADGKITPEEFSNCIKMIKELSDMSNNQDKK